MEIISLESIRGRLEASLPKTLLYTVAASPSHIGHLKQRLQRWWPGTDSIGDRVEALVKAYLERGDLQRGKNGIVRCVPPYVVARNEEAAVMDLFGNPLVEGQLCRRLEPKACVRYSLEESFPVRRLESTGGAIPLDPLFEEQVAFFTYVDVIERVPPVSQLSMPSPQECPSLPPGGYWEWYTPASRTADFQAGRWVPFQETVEGGKLLRQTAEDPLSQHRNQYYLYAGMRRGRHVHDDEARLWQFAIDHQAGRPIPWQWHDQDGVTVNGWLPLAAATALRVLSTGPVRRQRFHITFPVPASAKEAVQALAVRLGTTLT